MTSRPVVRILVVMLAFGGVACTLLKKKDTGDAGTDASTASALPDANVRDASPPRDASVDASTPAKPKTVAPKGSAGPSAVGNCYCLPDEGTYGHGNNQRLAPTWRAPTCTCDAQGVPLCLEPIKTCQERGGSCDASFDTLCKKRSGFKGPPLGPCQGWDSSGSSRSGTQSCVFDTGVDTYPGPRGGKCKGYMVTNKLVDGHVFCPAP